jgi:hypothetical protein
MEEYRKIKGFENYSVSNLGNVRNDKTGKIFQQSYIKGYKRVHFDDKKSYKVHRLVAESFIPNSNNKPSVDHIDNNKANNRVENLRWASCDENVFNSSIGKHNTSGIKGVHWNIKQHKWKAQINYNGQRIHLGCFENKEDAITARQLKANELFGKFVNKCEKIVNININLPPNTKLNININIEDDAEELRLLEKEFLDAIK